MELAIVGFGDTKKDCPKDIEVWSLNEFAYQLPRLDRWFQLHSREIINKNKKDKKHLKRLKESKCPVYMQEMYEDIKPSVKYPYNEMISKYGRIFASTFDYMMALAVEEKYTKISLYGVDLALYQEYEHQRPSAMYFIGLARGKGIDVWIHPESGLNKESNYAYSVDDEHLQIESLMSELNSTRQKIQDSIDNYAYTEGMKDAISNLKANPNLDLDHALEEVKRNLFILKQQLKRHDDYKKHLVAAMSVIAKTEVMVNPPDIRIGH